MIILNLEQLYTDTAKLSELAHYEQKAEELAGAGQVVKLTGRAPVWLYLRLAHVLHGKAKTLIYDSPVTGPLIIFDHDPY